MTGPASTATPTIGIKLDGYDVPVINERAVRAAAWLLFALGFVLLVASIATGSTSLMKPFGMFFIADMLIRVSISDKYSPTLALGRVLVNRQEPQWVGAPQKAFAWWLGVGMVVTSCFTMGVLATPIWVTLLLCGVCLSLLFLEAAFGICLGCSLQRIFSSTQPRYCASGKCAIEDTGDN